MKKLVVGCFILVLITLGWVKRGMGEQRPAPQGELQIVNKNRHNWVRITLNVMEHLRLYEQVLRTIDWEKQHTCYHAVSDHSDIFSHNKQVAQNSPQVWSCCTQRGQCPLERPQPTRTTCYCTSPYGPIPGFAC